MESRPKTEDYKLSLDAIRGRAAMPYNAFGVDSIPSPSVLDKQKDEPAVRLFVLGEHRGLGRGAVTKRRVDFVL